MTVQIECHGELVREPNTYIGAHPSGRDGLVRFNGNALIRSGTVIYLDCEFGPDFQTGHNVLVRQNTVVGQMVLLGTGTIVDGNIRMGDFIKIESNCYICPQTIIGSRCFLGPGVVLTNDRYPLKMRDSYRPAGPTLQDNVSIGGGAVLCPGVTIGTGSFIAAGTVVTKDVPAFSLVLGNPGIIKPLPDKLHGVNQAVSWVLDRKIRADGG